MKGRPQCTSNRVSRKIEKLYFEEHYPLYHSVMVTEPPQKRKFGDLQAKILDIYLFPFLSLKKTLFHLCGFPYFNPQAQVSLQTPYMPQMSKDFLSWHPSHFWHFQPFWGILGYKEHLMPIWKCIICIEFFSCLKHVRCLQTLHGQKNGILDSKYMEKRFLCKKNYNKNSILYGTPAPIVKASQHLQTFERIS